MSEPLRLLVVEDSADDAELLSNELKRSGTVHELVRVETLAALTQQLQERPFDVIISDFKLQGFTAVEALSVVRGSGRDVPFILVSGSIGEEVAAQAMRAGAHDFFLKSKLARLASAIEREMREAENRRRHREAIEHVHASERRLSALFNQAIVGIAQMDLTGRFVTVNDHFCTMVGRSREQLLALRFHDITHEDGVERAGALFTSALASGGSVVIETRYLRPDGSRVWTRSNIAFVSHAGSGAQYSVALVEDITDRKRYEEELRSAVRMRDEFLANASHELKTPLTALRLQLESGIHIAEGASAIPAASKLQAKLTSAMRHMERMSRLIDNLLAVTRITGGKFEPKRAHVDLRQIVVTTVARYADAAARAGSALAVRAERDVFGAWDPVALDLVVSNLVSNAVKFGEGKPIAVEVEDTDTEASVCVRDNGLGISADDHRRIFERFERAVRAEHYGGFGIGLWMVRELVEAHGGRIEVASRAGDGSSFRVTLPRQPPG